jgi:hypothetical protein
VAPLASVPLAQAAVLAAVDVERIVVGLAVSVAAAKQPSVAIRQGVEPLMTLAAGPTRNHTPPTPWPLVWPEAVSPAK